MTNPETPHPTHLHGAVTTTPEPPSPTALHVSLRAQAMEAYTLLDSIETQLLATRHTPLPAADHQANTHLINMVASAAESTHHLVAALGSRADQLTREATEPPGEG